MRVLVRTYFNLLLSPQAQVPAMRPPQLRLSAASGALAQAKLLLPLLMAQLWGEAGVRAWRRRRDLGQGESELSPPTPALRSGAWDPNTHPSAQSRPHLKPATPLV